MSDKQPGLSGERQIPQLPRPVGAGRPLDGVQRRHLAAVMSKFATGEYRWESVPQCLCGSTESMLIADHDRFGIPVGVVVCTTCGLARTTPRLARGDLGAFYRDDYHGLHFGVPDPDPSTTLFRVGQGNRIYAFLRDMLPNGVVRVAEVGAGTGQVLREFAVAARKDGRATTMVGCDLSAVYAAAGRSVGTPIEVGDATTLVRHGPFDLVILSHVVEHFPDPIPELETVRGLLSADGIAYVEVPGLFAIHRSSQYAYRLDEYLTLAHLYHFTRRTLGNVMGRAGFGAVRADEEVRGTFRPVPSAVTENPGLAEELLRYLRRLDRSPALRAKRAAITVRRLAVRVAHKVLGNRPFTRVKAALHGSGRP